jgi:hypothetical protein
MLNNPIEINDSGTERVVQLVSLIGSGGGSPTVQNGGLDVNIQNSTTDPVLIYYNKVTNSTTLAADVAIDDKTITVSSATGIAVGSYLVLFNPTLERFSTFFVTNVVSTTVTIDSPMDVAYTSGTFVDVAIVDMSVDGSSTTQTFGLRGTTIPPESVPIQFDLTRVLFQCICDSAVSYGLFGDIAELTNGVVMRKRDGRYKNIFNFKTNDEMANTMFDFDILEATNPAQGLDGFKGRLTFSGKDKMDTVVRLAAGEDAEILVQDDLTDLTRLRIIAEGKIL